MEANQRMFEHHRSCYKAALADENLKLNRYMELSNYLEQLTKSRNLELLPEVQKETDEAYNEYLSAKDKTNVAARCALTDIFDL